jgi:hypothetical protein
LFDSSGTTARWGQRDEGLGTAQKDERALIYPLTQPKLSHSLDEVLSILLPSASSSQQQPEGNILPVWAILPADVLTPVIAYLRLTDGAKEGVESFLLESAVKGETAGRWSFVGASASFSSYPSPSRADTFCRRVPRSRSLTFLSPLFSLFSRRPFSGLPNRAEGGGLR